MHFHAFVTFSAVNFTLLVALLRNESCGGGSKNIIGEGWEVTWAFVSKRYDTPVNPHELIMSAAQRKSVGEAFKVLHTSFVPPSLFQFIIFKALQFTLLQIFFNE
jgi:hypothetical protein